MNKKNALQSLTQIIAYTYNMYCMRKEKNVDGQKKIIWCNTDDLNQF